jgi:hypothetical protein
MQSAAGGTSQRLKPAVAIVRSLSSNPAPAPDIVPALLIDVIQPSLQPPLPDLSAVYDPVAPCAAAGSPLLAAHNKFRMRRHRQAQARTSTPDSIGYFRCPR